MMDIRVNIRSNLQIRAFYVFFIIIGIQSGVGILDAPANIFPYAKQDVWISIILSYVYMLLIFLLMLYILKQYKQADLFGIQVDLFGKFFGKLLGVIYIAYFFTAFLTIVYRYVEILTLFLYPILSPFIITIAIVGLTVYSVLGGFRVIVGVCFIFFLLTQPLYFLLYYPISVMETNHLLPLFQASFPEIIKSAKETTFSLLGFELILIIYPFVANKQHIKKPAIFALTYSSFILLVTTLISIGYYSFYTIERISFPVLTLFRGISFPFIERIDYFIVVEWMMVILPNSILSMWALTYGLKRLFNIKQRKSLYIIAILTIILTSFTFPKPVINKSLDFMAQVGFWLVFVYPLILLPIVIIKKKLMQGRGKQ